MYEYGHGYPADPEETLPPWGREDAVRSNEARNSRTRLAEEEMGISSYSAALS